jgi:hypothetical protein
MLISGNKEEEQASQQTERTRAGLTIRQTRQSAKGLQGRMGLEDQNEGKGPLQSFFFSANIKKCSGVVHKGRQTIFEHF